MDQNDYIAPLLQPTPSSVQKLIAAWEGLSLETQMGLLHRVENLSYPAYLANKIWANALNSENPYIRYLAAKKLSLNDENEAIEKIKNDPNPLVKYSTLETSFSLGDESLKNADLFVELPHDARLAKVRMLGNKGEELAGMLSEVAKKHLNQGKITEIEIFEILTEFLHNPEFIKEHHDNRITYDGYGEFLKAKDIESLWNLVPKLPESISHVLIDHLPEASGLGHEIPKDVISSLTDSQIRDLLYRKDIRLEKLRKQLFWESNGRDKDVKYAAASHNFNLDYDDFKIILSQAPKEKVSILKNLALMASDLSLCFYDAIHDVLFISDVSPLGNDFEDAIYARDALERGISDLEGWRREKEFLQLRLYRLAKEAVPWKPGESTYSPEGKIEFLKGQIVPGNTWETFMAFSKEWANLSWKTKDLEKYLPRIYEANEEDFEIDDTSDLFEEEESDIKILGQKIEENLNSLKDSIESSEFQNKDELIEFLEPIKEASRLMNETIQLKIGKLNDEIRVLLNQTAQIKTFLFLVLGLLIWFLITK